jgi:hypothetical protein
MAMRGSRNYDSLFEREVRSAATDDGNTSADTSLL